MSLQICLYFAFQFSLIISFPIINSSFSLETLIMQSLHIQRIHNSDFLIAISSSSCFFFFFFLSSNIPLDQLLIKAWKPIDQSF